MAAAAVVLVPERAPGPALAPAPAPTRELESAPAPAPTRELESAPAPAPAPTRELESAPAPAPTREMESALASASALAREQDRTPAPTQELESPGTLAQPQIVGGDVSFVGLVRLREHMKDKLMEYNTAVLSSQEISPDNVIAEKCSQSTTQNLQRDIEEAKVSFWNRTLALQRIQIMGALRNKLNQDDEESRLILETMKQVVLLSRKVMEYQEQAREKEQQLINIKRRRLSLKKDGKQKVQQFQTKRQKEEKANVRVTEREKLLGKLETERQMTTVIQNMFQAIIIASKVNWAEDPSLKAIVLQLEKIDS